MQLQDKQTNKIMKTKATQNPHQKNNKNPPQKTQNKRNLKTKTPKPRESTTDWKN